ncbi:uncharacterized protein LOC128251680 [Drosophila gunungcola]|uniref:Chitin-binding type-2 domain-containing protein n=1 Tax=Drosophila gunungcola TaxID=103775 RepID=A0A9Q0BV57_9MUSC|nr:uncharacterized protein LOC128251680 [Drosophila gunungcola]KAI8045381.1 hypothetical protein M5D96_001561 [Drosophila gunungcola]
MKLQRLRMIYHVGSLWALICLMHTSLASVIKDSIKCTEGSVAVDVDDCASYFQCLDDEAVHMSCPNGSYFEAKNEVCMVDEFDVCPTSRRKCFEGQLFEDFNDCAAYLMCSHGKLVMKRCPIGSYFNIISKSCRMDRRTLCTPEKKICLEGEITVDSEDCAGYLECVSGVVEKKKCPSGSFFEAIFKLCQVDENGVCSSASDQCSEGEVQVDPNNCAGYLSCQSGKLESKSCPSGSYFEPTYKTCIVDVNGVCVDAPAKCTEGELKLDPNNCAGYFKCIGGELVEYQCPAGTYYDLNLEACLVDSEGACVTTIKLCTEGVREEDPQDCGAYKQCIRGEVEYLKCDSGRYFNVTQQDCLFDGGQVCKKSEEKYKSEYTASTVADIHQQTGSTVAELYHNTKSTVGDMHQQTGSTLPDFRLQTQSTVVELNQSTESTTENLHPHTGSTVGDFLQYTENTVHDFHQYSDSSVTEFSHNTDINRFQSTESTTTNLYQYTESTVGYFHQYIENTVADFYHQTGSTVGQQTGSTVDEINQSSESTTENLHPYTESTIGYFAQYTESTVTDFPIHTESTVDLHQFTETSTDNFPQFTYGNFLQYSESTVADLDQQAGSTVDEFIHSTESTTKNLHQYTENTGYYTDSTVADFHQYAESTVTELNNFTESTTDNLDQYTESTIGIVDEVDQYKEISIENLEVAVVGLPSTDAILQTFTSNITCVMDVNGVCVDPLAKCTTGQKKLDPNNCAGYLLCTDEGQKEELCPSGFYFDTNLNGCFVDSRALCITNIKFCIEGVREQDPQDCAGYRQCIRGQVESRRCPFGSYFNVAERDCLPDEHKVCVKTQDNSLSDLQSSDSDQQVFLPDQTCVLDSNGLCADPLPKCREGQLKLDPNNCAGYMICIDGVLRAELCPTGSYYESEFNACLVDRRGICVTNIEICDEGLREEDPHDCAGYRECIRGEVQNLKCPSGSYFSVLQRDCLIDLDEVCVNTGFKYYENYLLHQY